MYTVKADIKKNRLYVTLDGFFHFPEMKDCTDRTIEESRKLASGYDVITDISRFKAMDQGALTEVQRGQAFFLESGVRYALRVRGAAILMSIQFARAGKKINYIPVTVATVADAERYLDMQTRTATAF